MTKDQLRKQIDKIITVGEDDDEAAHSREDALHLGLIKEFAPDWVWVEVERLNQAEFSRWCA